MFSCCRKNFHDFWLFLMSSSHAFPLTCFYSFVSERTDFFLPQVKILRFWQPSPDLILARWEITLYPRVLNGVYGTKMSFDGTSEFSFNQAGKICRHRVDILNTDGLQLNLHFLLRRNMNCPIPTC